MKKRRSMNRKLIVPISILMLLQGIIFVFSILGAGVIKELRDTAYYNLSTKVDTTKNTLQDYMHYRWSNFTNFQKVLEVFRWDNQNANLNDMSPQMVEALIGLLDDSHATGAFVIYDQPKEGIDGKEIIYLRDLDPDNKLSDYADLQLEYGSPDLAKNRNITLTNHWKPYIDMDQKDEKFSFYYDLQKKVQENNNYQIKDFGRWSLPVQLHPDGKKVLIYSIPLLDENNEMHGVVGIDISVDYLQTFLPYQKLTNEDKGAFVLAMEDANGKLHRAVTKGPYYPKMIPNIKNVFISSLGGENGNIYQITPYKSYQEKQKPVLAARTELDLYDSNTPFGEENWILYGMTWKDTLLLCVRKLQTSLILGFLSAVVLGIIGAFIISMRFSRPLRVMIKSLRESDPEEEIKLPKLQIAEIDELAEAVEKLSADVSYSASRLSEIIKMMDLPMGTIEYDKSGGDVFCTLDVGVLLNFSEEHRQCTRLKRDVFDEEMKCFNEAMVCVEQGEIQKNVFHKVRVQVIYEDGGLHWIQFKILDNEQKYLAIVQDVTEEVQEKMKLEWERDYDPLTNLYNRRCFEEMVIQLLEKSNFKVGAMVMWDLDNLKFINDTYGHDFGDAYIIQAAELLSTLNLFGCVVARMSGDEFLAFFHGFDSKEEIREIVQRIHHDLRNTVLPLPSNHKVKIRASAGICWYPDDGKNYEELVRFSDFAMYRAKNTIKGEVREFEMEVFRRDEVLFSGQEALNRFIEEKLLDFAFQPIVDAKTGEIFAYEALMRPRSDELKTVGDVMRLAKAQSKMYQIEVITMYGVLEAFLKQKDAFGNAKLFLNSIPNIFWTEKDCNGFEETYKEELHRLVVEIIESDRSDRETFSVKKERTESWGAQIALDDFGSGYNTESSLLYMSPDYIKIDMTIIRGIDVDENRKNLVSSILTYTKPRQIKVIAEGIETKGEMEAVLDLGVDLMQGFYIARPNMEVKDIPEQIKKEIREYREY